MAIRIFYLPILFLFVLGGNAQDVPAKAPGGFGQLENAPRLIPGGVDDEGRKFSYLGQASEKQKIILTASNGFFTKGTCRAAGKSDLPKIGDSELIVPNYAFLENWNNTEGTLRWHFHISKPGGIRFQAHLDASNSAAGSKIEFQFAGQTKEVTVTSSNGKRPQAWDLVFDVKEAGEYQLSLQAKKITDSSSGVGKLMQIEAFGPAIEDANLLRVRWRPAAVHGGYESSKVEEPQLLVMTTRSMIPISSYSPVTTPFGYFGTSFTSERRSNGEFNFSMWGGKGAISDLKQMPHLLGVGSPDGEFSGFGHEGSGVKGRGWTPMPDGPELVVQALRVERGDVYDSYYGYYFDHPTKAWKFYCSGNKWHGGKSNETLKVGSFCEVPGPPQVERTGDIYREVRRRGWYHAGETEWVAMETFKPGGRGSKGEPVNKRWYTSPEGEFSMGCGGIRLYEFSAAKAPDSDGGELPYFLTSESASSLFTMPVEFGDIVVSHMSPESATIDVMVKNGGELKSGAIYYGTVDALTFAPRELHGTEKKSELSKSVNDSAWQEVSVLETLTEGVNQIELSKLKASTAYFFRVLVNNSVSRVWNAKTLTFTTPATGSTPMKKKDLPPGPSFGEEELRTWTYSSGGTVRKIEGRLTGISAGKIQIERKIDGKKGVIELKLFSAEDRAYVESKR